MTFEAWAKLITVGYLSLIFGIIAARFNELTSLPLNELGDFAAGAFGPAAFLWLVLGYRMQGHELRASTETLKLQVDELRGSSARNDMMMDPNIQLRYTGRAVKEGVEQDGYALTSLRQGCKALKVSFSACNAPPSNSFLMYDSIDAGAMWMIFFDTKLEDVKGGTILVEYMRLNGSVGKNIFHVFHIPPKSVRIQKVPELF